MEFQLLSQLHISQLDFWINGMPTIYRSSLHKLGSFTPKAMFSTFVQRIRSKIQKLVVEFGLINFFPWGLLASKMLRNFARMGHPRIPPISSEFVISSGIVGTYLPSILKNCPPYAKDLWFVDDQPKISSGHQRQNCVQGKVYSKYFPNLFGNLFLHSKGMIGGWPSSAECKLPV